MAVNSRNAQLFSEVDLIEAVLGEGGEELQVLQV